jgi:VanZ family protein
MNRDIPSSMTTTILKSLAWLLAAAVTFATLGPPSLRPHSGLGQDGEHALAFVLIGLAFGLAYTPNRLLISAISVVMIGVIEILQLWAPGRHARFEDFVVDALAACVGLAVAAGLDRAVQRSRRANANAS